MPTFAPRTHSFNPQFGQPPPLVTGRDRARVDIPPDHRIGNPSLTFSRRDAGCDAKIVAPDTTLLGSQDVYVIWVVAPVPGATVTYTLTVPTSPLPNGTGRVLLFEHAGFEGQMIEVRDGLRSLSGRGFNDKVSSIVVLSGTWVFYRNDGFDSPYASGGQAIRLTKGMYNWIVEQGIQNDDLSSLRAVQM